MKIKKYQVITGCLVIYALFMTIYFGLDLLKSGQSLRFYLTLGGEITVIILAFFALRRRDRLREQREREVR